MYKQNKRISPEICGHLFKLEKAGEDSGRFRAVVTGLICGVGSKEEKIRVFVGVDGDHITE